MRPPRVVRLPDKKDYTESLHITTFQLEISIAENSDEITPVGAGKRFNSSLFAYVEDKAGDETIS